jgi:hypothetical protein
MVKEKKHQSGKYESTGMCGPNAFQVDLKSPSFPHTVAKSWVSLEVRTVHIVQYAFVFVVGLIAHCTLKHERETLTLTLTLQHASCMLCYLMLQILPEAESYIRRAGLGRTAPNNLATGVVAT